MVQMVHVLKTLGIEGMYGIFSTPFSRTDLSLNQEDNLPLLFCNYPIYHIWKHHHHLEWPWSCPYHDFLPYCLQKHGQSGLRSIICRIHTGVSYSYATLLKKKSNSPLIRRENKGQFYSFYTISNQKNTVCTFRDKDVIFFINIYIM